MDVKVVRTAEAFRIDPTGQTRTVMVVMYMVGEQGPFSYEVPTDDFDAVKVRAELEQRAERIRSLMLPR